MNNTIQASKKELANVIQQVCKVTDKTPYDTISLESLVTKLVISGRSRHTQLVKRVPITSGTLEKKVSVTVSDILPVIKAITGNIIDIKFNSNNIVINDTKSRRFSIKVTESTIPNIERSNATDIGNIDIGLTKKILSVTKNSNSKGVLIDNKYVIWLNDSGTHIIHAVNSHTIRRPICMDMDSCKLLLESDTEHASANKSHIFLDGQSTSISSPLLPEQVVKQITPLKEKIESILSMQNSIHINIDKAKLKSELSSVIGLVDLKKRSIDLVIEQDTLTISSSNKFAIKINCNSSHKESRSEFGINIDNILSAISSCDLDTLELIMPVNGPDVLIISNNGISNVVGMESSQNNIRSAMVK